MSPPRQLHIPIITDAYTLNRAVQIDPTAAFDQLQIVFHERNELKIRVSSLQKEVDEVKKDFLSHRDGHEKMEQIWLQKQELMWKFVERIKKERKEEERVVRIDGDVAAGKWIHKEGEEDKEKKVTKEDVEKIWSSHFRVSPPDEGVSLAFQDQDIVEEERGRSRVAKVLQKIERETASTTDLTTARDLGVEEDSGNNADGDIKMDPSAVYN